MTNKSLQIAVDNILKPIEQAAGMGREFYANPAYADQERDLILAKSWTALELKSELPEKGHAKPMDLLNLPLLITHAEDGKIRVFHNICRHRGMRLVDTEGPIDGVISCPYHAWTYTLKGTLSGTPNVAGIGKHHSKHFNPSKYGLQEIASAEFMNVLFINLDGNAPPFEQYFQPLKKHFYKLFGNNGFQQIAMAETDNKAEFEVDCNWKLAVENFAEAYHLPALHPELNVTSPLDVHYNVIINENFAGQGTNNYNDQTQSAQLPMFSDWANEHIKCAEYICAYPNLLIGLHNNYAYVMILCPLNSEQTLEKLEIFYIGEGAVAEKYESARATALHFWISVLSEDNSAIEGMQKGRRSPYYDGGVYAVPLEECTHHFHQWIANKLKSTL